MAPIALSTEPEESPAAREAPSSSAPSTHDESSRVASTLIAFSRELRRLIQMHGQYFAEINEELVRLREDILLLNDRITALESNGTMSLSMDSSSEMSSPRMMTMTTDEIPPGKFFFQDSPFLLLRMTLALILLLQR